MLFKASLKPREKHWLLAGSIMFRQIGIPPNMDLSFEYPAPQSKLNSSKVRLRNTTETLVLEPTFVPGFKYAICLNC